MASSHRALNSLDLDALDALPGDGGDPSGATPDEGPDVFVALDGEADERVRIANGRHDNYLAVTRTEQVLRIADAAVRVHAPRLLLLAPLLGWQQMSASTRLLPDGLEYALASRPLPTILILKPTREAAALPKDAGPLQRFARLYLSQLRFMLASTAQTLRATELAQLAVDAMRRQTIPGLHVLSADDLQRLAKRP